ncbi:hypothetical protein [Streptomyces sp. NBC_00572]|uniref:hypothetical protein n=1 Tax=Streptomyces sp. NBC_00572 TaxID=2903664 RepID=UPI00225315E4|nr:hypothetical protein [Streptomyces sp. NBC_00572]MCX4986026.1 hypothetical protein [Streptomyces sp. NBC_00572]
MILAPVTRGHSADHGTVATTHNKITGAAGPSKTVAYHSYDHDPREGLLATVLDGVLRAGCCDAPNRTSGSTWSTQECVRAALLKVVARRV